MIIDCFTFWKEFDILEIRLNELYDTVDYFVLVEAAYTQSLIPKPFYFEDNKNRFSKFLDKIVHVKVSDKIDISSNPWAFENFQRRCIMNGLQQLQIKHDDYILVSDVDEIPSSECIKNLLPNMQGIMCFGMTYHVYYLNLVMKHKLWPGTVAIKAGDLNCDTHSLIKIRDRLPHHLIPCDTGWHLGYQGGKDIVFEKYFSCIEPFDKKNGIPDRELFNKIFDERIKDGGSFIFTDNLQNTNLKLYKIDNSKLPKHIINNMDHYKSLLIE